MVFWCPRVRLIWHGEISSTLQFTEMCKALNTFFRVLRNSINELISKCSRGLFGEEFKNKTYVKHERRYNGFKNIPNDHSIDKVIEAASRLSFDLELLVSIHRVAFSMPDIHSNYELPISSYVGHVCDEIISDFGNVRHMDWYVISCFLHILCICCKKLDVFLKNVYFSNIFV